MAKSRGNGSGSIAKFKNSKGKYRYRARVSTSIGIDPETGKTKVKSKTIGVYDRKADAEAALVEYNQSPYDLEHKIKTVGDLYDVWSEYYFAKIKQNSIRSVTCAWRYCDDIHNMALKKLNKGHLERLLQNACIIDEKGEKRMASADTRCRIKSIFNLMLDFAYDNNLVVKNVARTFDVNDIRKQVDYAKKIKEPFTQKEIDLLWGSIDDYPFVDVILIGIYSGFRPQEVCELRVENVNLEDDMIIGGMKTEAGTNRKVPIHPLIKPLVEKRYNQAVRLKSDWLLNDPSSQTGLHLTYDKFRHRFRSIMAALGINDRTGHCMRVTFITKAYASGIPEYILKRIVGHSLKMNVTDGVYNRVSFDELYNAICKITK